MMDWNPRFRCTGVLVVAAVLALAVPAGAATFIDMEIPELVAESEAVIEGRVIETESFWDEKGLVIVTEAVIQVDEAIVGKSEKQIRVRVPGGEVGGYIIQAPGFPTFERDERVVVFVHRPDTGDGLRDEALRVTGHPLGKYRVVEEGGLRMARPTVDSNVLLVSPSGGRTEAPRALSLDRLKEDVRDAARAVGLNR